MWLNEVHRTRRVPLFIVAAVICLTAIACSGTQELRPIPTPSPAEPTPVPRPVSIPADERSHDERLEWWYYNGHLYADSGEEFGFHFVIFKALDGDEPAYSAQLGITDVQALSHNLDSRLFAGNAEQADADLFRLQISDWSLDITEASHRIRGVMDDGTHLSLDLEIPPGARPVLHADIGWFAAPTGWSYYYSWPDMPANGSLKVGGREYEMTGTGWFDHQWGDFFTPGAPGGWQWMGLQLGDGETLMVTETRNPDGTTDTVFGTWSDATGATRSLTEADGIRIEVLDTWVSPNTGAEYPSLWRVNVDGLNLDVEVRPVVADQEVDEGVPRAAFYWEGKVVMTGTYRGEPVEQPGFVELTGYAQPEPIPWRE